jgi:hypothetical protein
MGGIAVAAAIGRHDSSTSTVDLLCPLYVDTGQADWVLTLEHVSIRLTQPDPSSPSAGLARELTRRSMDPRVKLVGDG